MTTKYQRQWTEFEVIKSIYEKEFEELKYPWKIDHPPWFKVNLKFDGNTSVGVEFRMSAAYPDVIPEILVQKTTNNCIGGDQQHQHLLGKDQLGYIRTKLVEQADELVGSEMVFDLIERAKDLIETLAKRGKSSFHSEMLERQEEVALNLQEKERLLEEKRLKEEERKRREEMESLERKIIEEIEAKDKKQNPKHSSTHFIATTNSSVHGDTRHSPKVYSFNPAVQVADGGRQIERVYEVERENYNNNNSSKTVMNYNWPFGRIIRVSDYSKTNEEFDLKTVSLSHPFLQSFGGHRQLDTLIKKISSHSSELLVGKHENVIKCFGGSFSDEKENSKNMILLYEKTDEEVVPLKLILEQAGALTLPKVIEYLKQICSGLNHLHAAGIAHRELGIENIVLETKSSKIKISDYTVWRVLADLSRGHEIEFNGGKMVGYAWPAPEVAARPNFIGKKTDTWAVGRIAMQMIFGIDILDQCPVSECSRVLSSTRNDVLIQFVSCCLIEDSGKRPTIEDLMKSNLFTTHCISNFIMLQPVEVIKEQRKSPLSAVASFSNLKGNSRYKSDFEELEFLGRGGFGSVVKVRNKIDDRYYAVKKILLDPRDVEYNKKILREVTTLSRLHHERIIRYYQAWIEDNDRTDETSSGGSKNDYDLSTSSFGTATDAISNVGIMNNLNFLQRDMVDFSLGPKSNTNRFSELQEENDDFFERGDSVFSDEKTISTTEAGTDTNTATDMTTTTDTETETENESISTSDSDSKTTFDDIKSGPVFKSQCLYIQMEYCPNQTLRDLIDERSQDPSGHYLDPPEIWRLFRQIVEGLVHIHAQGMMHRDLKPSNIFLDSNGDVKIGDFGLAVTRVESAGHIGGGVGGGSGGINLTRAGSKAESILEHHSFTGESHTLNIGTPFYVSPEQQQQHRSETSKYNQKVDMYSLGIIFIELWVPFSTGMERVQRLRDCRLNEIKLPDGLDGSVIKICKKLLCHDPRTRYSSLELLKSDLLPPMLEEELMEEAMRTVAQPETAHYPRLISTIFQRQAQCGLETIRPKDFAFDVHSGNATEAGQFVTSQRIRCGIERIFHRHGAVEINPPLFYLPLHPSEDMFVVLDESGQRLELPNNLTRPFSRWVAQSNVKDLKRYAFDRVYKKISQVPGRQPYQPIEASFDIIHSNRIDDGILEECEVVRVAIDGVLSGGGGGGGGGLKADQICLKFNNLKLRNMILNGREVKEEIISVGPLISWNRKDNPYLECLDEEMIKVLKVGDEGNNNNVNVNLNLNLINRLMLHYSRSSEAKWLLVGLSRRLMMLQKISIPEKCKIVFDPLMSVGGEMFKDDFVFTVTVKMNKKLKGVELVSSGGRYDQMVEEFKFPTARLEGKGPFAVGCSIYVHKLRLIYHLSSSTHLDTSNQPAFRILIDKEINSDEMWLINEMWRNGIEFGLIEGEGGKKRVSSCCSSSSNSNYYVLQVKTNTKSVRIGKAIRGGSEEVGFEWIIGRVKKLSVLLEEESCSLAEDCSGNNNNSTYEDDTNTYGTYNNNNSSNYSNNTNNNNHNHNTTTTTNNNPHPHELNLHPILVGKSSNGISTMLREKVIKSIKPILQHRPEVIIHEVSRESIKRIMSSFNTGNSTGGTGNSSTEGDGEGEQKILQVINRIITNNAPSTNSSTSPTVGRMFIFYNHRDGNMEVMIKK